MSEPAYIHIHWHPPIPIDAVPRSDIAQQPGLYQVCGDHPVYGPKTLLYIGKSERQTVAERVDSESWQLRDAQAEVRVGRIVSQEKLDPPQIERQIEEAERLLEAIRAEEEQQRGEYRIRLGRPVPVDKNW